MFCEVVEWHETPRPEGRRYGLGHVLVTSVRALGAPWRYSVRSFDDVHGAAAQLHPVGVRCWLSTIESRVNPHRKHWKIWRHSE